MPGRAARAGLLHDWQLPACLQQLRPCGAVDSAVHAAAPQQRVGAAPAVVDVVTNRMELTLPPKTTMEQAKGFGIYLAKAINSARGDEVVELARTKIFR